MFSEHVCRLRSIYVKVSLKEGQTYTEQSKIAVRRNDRNSKVGILTSFERLDSTSVHMQVSTGTGQGVRRSECPLLACHIHCKCSIKALGIW